MVGFAEGERRLVGFFGRFSVTDRPSSKRDALVLVQPGIVWLPWPHQSFVTVPLISSKLPLISMVDAAYSEKYCLLRLPSL